MPRERLQVTREASVHQLMDRIEAIDREVDPPPLKWSALMYGFEPD
jgi:hypothetical protein